MGQMMNRLLLMAGLLFIPMLTSAADDSFEEYTDTQLLDMLIDSELLPTEVVDTAIKVNQQMLDIMVAGATGEF